jgi:DNA helicase-2/ATP-dependent DNA helicase PcrA
MTFIVDFHIHSHFSIATSKLLVPEHLDYWARLKGIRVVGTGDFTHPGWVKELKEKLEPAEEGLYRLKAEYQKDKALETPFLPTQEVRFILTAEISCIYKKNGKVRKVHNVIFAPDFETVEKIQHKLTSIGGNITSDGRPILGLDSRDLLEMALESSEDIFFVPAHIWTPWFSVLGAKSGFDTIEECYDDLSKHIYAVETGLSSDPPMNWMCSFLDQYTLLSNSDAHSPEKLGRNANIFDTELSYDSITAAMKKKEPGGFLGTIDMFPQEGKYHYDGHRKCGVCWDPVQTLKNNEMCCECGRPVTVGVMNRVVQVSDREDLEMRPNRRHFYSIIPLKEILSEIRGVSANSKKVALEYMTLIKRGIPELQLLLDTAIEEIREDDHDELAEAIQRMRNRQVKVKEGFDGEFGVVKVFQEGELKNPKNQKMLFDSPGTPKILPMQSREMINFDLKEFRRLKMIQHQEKKERQTDQEENPIIPGKLSLKGLNQQQQKAVKHHKGPALIIAGPGTGKTRVLTHRIAHLVLKKNVKPGNILAVTFTNKAAAEIAERLDHLLEETTFSGNVQVSTFHALGLSILKEILSNPIGNKVEQIGRDPHFTLIDEEERKVILQKYLGCQKKQVNRFSSNITRMKQAPEAMITVEDEIMGDVFDRYDEFLKMHNAFDLDDLIYVPLLLFDNYPEILKFYQNRYRWILVDEFQDINHAQYQMIKRLAPKKDANLCVIGDPDQSIYGFRGADASFIKSFSDDFPKTNQYILERSYRCSDLILKASGNVITEDKKKYREIGLKGVGKGVKVKISGNNTHKSEAEFVARSIEEMMGGLRFFSMDSSITEGNKTKGIESLSDFAVLCRMKSQMEALEKALKDHSIPFQSVGELPFFKQEPVKSIINILKCYSNPQSRSLMELFIGKNLAIFPKVSALLSKKAQGRKSLSLKDTVSEIIDCCFAEEKKENEAVFKKLAEFTKNFGDDVKGFLQYCILGHGADAYQSNLENVALMTLHASKGLEFKCVFIVGCEDGLLPYSLFENQVSDVDEERRLLYVGMTRAKKFLFLSHAEKRIIQGREFRLNRSPFLDSIEKQLIEFSQLKKRKLKEKEILQPTLFDL